MRLVDTSVAIDGLRGHEQAAALLEREFVEGRLVASEITRFEILGGMRPEEEEATESLFRSFAWVPVGEVVARRAAELSRRFRRRSVGIEDADYLIAATALELGVPLLTTNIRHFPMLPGLRPAY